MTVVRALKPGGPISSALTPLDPVWQECVVKHGGALGGMDPVDVVRPGLQEAHINGADHGADEQPTGDPEQQRGSRTYWVIWARLHWTAGTEPTIAAIDWTATP
jgi:hypothetical protein